MSRNYYAGPGSTGPVGGDRGYVGARGPVRYGVQRPLGARGTVGAVGAQGPRGTPGPQDFGTTNELMRLLITGELRDREFTADDVNWQNDKGNTLLMVAIMMRSFFITKIMNTEGFDPNLQNDDGCTALILYLRTFSINDGSSPRDVRKLALHPEYKHDIVDNDGKCAHDYENDNSTLVAHGRRTCMVEYYRYKERHRAKLDKEFQALKAEYAEYKMMVKQLWMAPGMPGAVMGDQWKAIRKQSM